MELIMNKDEISKFSIEIETLAESKEISYIEAVLLYCENTGFEIEVAAKMISNALKAKIEIEAENLNFLPKSETNKLPF